jgi:hypothetical protein
MASKPGFQTLLLEYKPKALNCDNLPRSNQWNGKMVGNREIKDMKGNCSHPFYGTSYSKILLEGLRINSKDSYSSHAVIQSKNLSNTKQKGHHQPHYTVG